MQCSCLEDLLFSTALPYLGMLLANAVCTALFAVPALLALAQVHGPHIDSVAAYEKHRADIKRAKAEAWAARKQKAAARKARKLATQQVKPPSAQCLVVLAFLVRGCFACTARTYTEDFSNSWVSRAQRSNTSTPG
jgi:uncharacterized membrane protein YdfJ with MMPL/SSD domain